MGGAAIQRATELLASGFLLDHVLLDSFDQRALRARFRRRHWIRLPRFLSPHTVKILARHLEKAPFVEETFQVSHREKAARLDRIVTMLLSHPELFAFVGKIVGSPDRIRSISGTIYRQSRNARHYVVWHSDVDYPPFPGKLIEATLLINLGGPYQGGALEIRAPDSKRLLARIANPRAGDAIIFRNNLLHRSTAVVGRRPKVTFAGCFSPDLLHGRMD